MALLWGGMFCNQWFVRENARANVVVDQMHASLDKQNDALEKQNTALQKRNAAMTNQNRVFSRLVLDQRQMQTRRGTEAQIDKLDAQIKEAQGQFDTLLSDSQKQLAQYRSASERYGDASKRFQAACDGYCGTLQANSRKSVVSACVFNGGAVIALAAHFLAQTRLRRRP